VQVSTIEVLGSGFDGDACKQHLDREGVAEHVRVAALDLAVRPPDISQLEQAAIASLPIGDRAFGIPIATPEETRNEFRARP
jgi:hypothetical protein